MINNFEDITGKLSEAEMKLVPIFVSALSKKIGRGNIITNRQMRKGLLEKKDIAISEPRVRKIVNFIRNHSLIDGLVATSKGYYVSRNPAEVERYIQSLDQHEASIRNTKKNFQLYLMKLLNKDGNGTK